jgi:tRNA-Thr(GGU) m(6)t(6)A37 methyltransferase TsaA
MEFVAVGTVESPLTELASASKQGDEGATEAWLVFDEGFADALDGIAAGDALLLLSWLDRADRKVLRVHPRGDPANPEQGVLNTRSPDRPNPVALHRVTVMAIDGRRLRVRDLESRRSEVPTRQCDPASLLEGGPRGLPAATACGRLPR